MSRADANPSDYKAAVEKAVLRGREFVGLTLSRKQPADPREWRRVTVRPVLIQGRRQMQFCYFGARRNRTKNYFGKELRRQLAEVLAMPFTEVHVQSKAGDLHVRVTRNARPLVSRGKPSSPDRAPALTPGHVKRQPLAVDQPNAFLEAIGIMTAEGAVRAGMQAKFRQVNEFLRIIGRVVEGFETAAPIRLVDCGCGLAYLSFAAFHYLNDILAKPAELVGIDSNPEVITKCNERRKALGWDGLEFHVAAIADYAPAAPPDLVVSLHACDTATDEAIAQGIRWGSRAILAAPCCQHELNQGLQSQLFRPVLRHGVLKEALADLLTDAFRAHILRLMGYRTKVIEFALPEDTPKNVMIRAEKGLNPGPSSAVREYLELKEFWQATPRLEQLLGDELRQYL